MRRLRNTSLAVFLSLGLMACGAQDVAGNANADVETGSSDATNTRNETTNRSATTDTNQTQSYRTDVGPVYVNGYREIAWEDLMPEGEEERLMQLYQQQMAMLYSAGPIMEGSAADTMVQIGTFNVVDELDGQKVRLPGYTVPFEFGRDAEITEFLLVPYFGACIHAPPPPPNQTIFVQTDTAIRVTDLAQAVWINGVIQTAKQSTELADTAYTFVMESIEEYEY